MRKYIAFLLALSCLLSLIGCSKEKMEDNFIPTASDIEITEATETTPQNEVLQFFADEYEMRFTLWGPEGQD